MKLMHFFIALSLLVASFSVSPQPVQAQEAPPEFNRKNLSVPGELVVTFSDKADIEAVAQKSGASLKKMRNGVALFSFKEDADVRPLASQIQSLPGVIAVQPNYVYWIPEKSDPKAPLVKVAGLKVYNSALEPIRTLDVKTLKSLRSSASDLSFANDWYSQWGNNAIKWPLVWKDSKIATTICELDTGVDSDHKDFFISAGNYTVLPGWDFVNEDSIPNDDNGHGTHVAGTMVAVSNNGIGVAGISNGKVLAVKVLNAQGFGTSYDINQGIRFCADNTSIRVLSMSLGGSTPDPLIYDGLNYAVNTKKKLVVASAGNDSTSDVSFPAGWAGTYICKDGSDTGDPEVPCDDTYSTTLSNKLSAGLISVGAARSPESSEYDVNNDGLLWVDTDGDGIQITNESAPGFWDEHFYPEECAASFSNYGRWVNIIAPGESIQSTVPFDQPYYLQHYFGVDNDKDGYASLSGTSMAAPHVAAVAARLIAFTPTVMPTEVKLRMMDRSTNQDLIGLAMDPNISDPTMGYLDLGFTGEAPYCWPDDTYGTAYDMSNAAYLDIAGVLLRGGIFGSIYDANTGVPTPSTLVYGYVGTSLKDIGYVADGVPYYTLNNLYYKYKMSIKIYDKGDGYTSGQVQIASNLTIQPGYYISPALASAAVPPLTNRLSVVTGWDQNLWNDGWATDLDMVTFLPKEVSLTPRWVFDGGELSAFPRMFYNREGGYSDPLGIESLTIMPRYKAPTYPYYNTGTRNYNFFLYEWEMGGLNTPGVHARIWQNGKILATVIKAAVCDSDGADDTYGYYDSNDPAYADDEVFWKIGSFTLDVFTPADQCSIDANTTGGGLLPYDFSLTKKK